MIKAREIVIVFIIIRGLFHFIVTLSREVRILVLLEIGDIVMSIYAKCCIKDYIDRKGKCEICHKSFNNFVARIKDSKTERWK